jgi:large subunit ribosomal protein L22e
VADTFFSFSLQPPPSDGPQDGTPGKDGGPQGGEGGARCQAGGSGCAGPCGRNTHTDARARGCCAGTARDLGAPTLSFFFSWCSPRAFPPQAAAAATPKAPKALKAAAAPAKKAKPVAGKKGAAAPKGKKAKKETKKFLINCTQPVKDSIFDAAAFEKFLVDHIKVAGKTNNLGTNVSVTRDQAILTVRARAHNGKKEKKKTNGLGTTQVTANLPFSKRYVKYLTKKFLKKSQLKDFMHVIANAKNSYEIRYYKVDNADGEGDAE